jgi:NAD(P)-dependent dehydrogenase (short-subunit alcohol dehydrogenase family)
VVSEIATTKIEDGVLVVPPPKPLGDRQHEQDISGKVALITGASRGIGKRTALALAERGAKVVVTARTVSSGGTLAGTVGETVGEIEALGSEALAVAADLSQEEDLERIVRSAVDRFGGIDILINNAAVTIGHNWDTPIEQMPRADWMYHFAVNLHAPFTLTQLVIPIMEARGGGRIINVTTGSHEVFRLPEEPPPLVSIDDFNMGSPAYFASKRALDRFGNVIAPQLAKKNIALITVMPGFVASEVAVHRVAGTGIGESMMIGMDVPARMLLYFASCEKPGEYAGRIFWAERELKEFGIDPEIR